MTNNLLDPTPMPRLTDGIDHPVTVRHKLDSSLACLDFHVKQNSGRPARRRCCCRERGALMVKEVILPLLVWLLLAVVAAGIMTGAFLVTDSRNCNSRGGTFTVEGSTAWCRF